MNVGGRPAVRPWRTAFLAGMASYLDAATIVSTGIALVLFAPDLGLGEWSIGALSAVLTLCFAIGAVVGGRLGDRFGRRRVFTVTLAVLATGLSVLAAATAPWMLAVGVVVAGLAIGSDLPVSLALIAEEAGPADRGKMVGLSAVLWLVGIAASVGLATVVGGLGSVGARVLYAHLVVVAVGVSALRRGLRESVEWTTASSAADESPGDRATRSAFRLLVRPPLLAAFAGTAAFYALWNLAANTMGQFATFLFVNVAGASVSFASLVSLVGLPLGVLGGVVFMRVVDGARRRPYVVAGFVVALVAFAVPLVLGVNVVTMTACSLLFGLSAPFFGETIYKVWSQELFPTLVRSSAQGQTMAAARVAAAAWALVTPVIASSSPAVLFGVLLGCIAGSGAIGLGWVARLSVVGGARPAEVGDGPSVTVGGGQRPTAAGTPV
ncbi:MFS transporter [Actinotalea sp. M2MS4P-6]|uniref:MFS transporter n=1 Tax=Actinotalea sp. M2MS4P-6 TaxID=2983762 RepID=UPI0021E3E9BF|nr:MFS transporter [Actinotalea sp. M2MS4P-6]MCV2395888.1 MFS transporter [Actinotalea sp. M2MS4P-6]